MLVDEEPAPDQPAGSEFVRWVQHSLNLVLSLRIPVDGIITAETREAVRDFQSRMGLPADGIVGPDTRQALTAERRKLAETPAEEELETDQALREEVEPFEYEFGMNRKSSAYIRWVQRSLNRLLGLSLPESGSADSSLAAAVRSFQTRAKLSADGKVGPATEHAMVEAGADPPPASGDAALVQTVLPKAGAGFYRYRLPHRSYGRFETIFNLEHLGRLWQLRHPNGPRIGIGELSLRGGGDISGHASHEKGLDVDIRPMRSDGREEGVTWKQTGNYSHKLTQELIDVIRDSGTQRVQHIFFNDPKARRVQPWPNHDDHLHVRFHPPSSASSRELEELGGSMLDEYGTLETDWLGEGSFSEPTPGTCGARCRCESCGNACESELEVFGSELFADEFEILGEACRGFEIEPVDYISWVQRSLNRIVGSGLTVDGKPSKKYRDAVKEFQQAFGFEANGEVNAKTQDRLIRVNEKHADYVEWVQRALNKNGAGLALDEKIGTNTRNAIKNFQKARVPDLCVDGFVGAKTELRLIEGGGGLPPGHIESVKPKPPGPKPQNITTRFKEWLPRVIDELEKRPPKDRPVRAICWLKMLMRKRLRDKYITAANAQRHQADELSVALGKYLTSLGLAVDSAIRHRKTLPRIVEGILELDAEVYKGIARVESLDARQNRTGYGAVTNPTTRRMYNFVHTFMKDPESIYYCFAESIT